MGASQGRRSSAALSTPALFLRSASLRSRRESVFSYAACGLVTCDTRSQISVNLLILFLSLQVHSTLTLAFFSLLGLIFRAVLGLQQNCGKQGFPMHLLPPQPPPPSASSPDGAFVTTGEPPWTRHRHPECTMFIRADLVPDFCGFGRMCYDVRPSLQYRTGWFHGPKILCSTCSCPLLPALGS